MTGRLNALFAKQRLFLVFLSVLIEELLNTARVVDKLLTTRIERMARVANIDFQFGLRAARYKRVAATATNLRFNVIRMDFFFHCANLSIVNDVRPTSFDAR